MRIYLDGMLFRHAGIGRIYQNLLQGLVESPEILRIYTLIPRARKDDFLHEYPYDKIEAVFTDLPFDYREYFRKGPLIRKFNPAPDIHYFPYHNVPYFLKGTVVSTVCDLIPISPFSCLPWHAKSRFRYLVSHALKVSTRVVCISEFTKSQVLDRFDVSPDLLEVIYPPLEDDPSRDQPVIPGEDRMVEGDYLLFVGSRNPHKNLKCLIDAFKRLAPEFPGLKLVIAGARMRQRDEVDEASETEGLRGKVIPYVTVTDREIENLYSNARVFVFPSLIEGFGIPPLEAMTHGIPVVCSDITVIREVCGDTVRYADPSDPQDFAKVIREVLTGPQDPVRVLAGRSRAKTYNREACAGRYIRLFKRCLAT
ncbi:MAG: glycosyltransferase family 1 protein [Deltaproteobacteria bacterium]|nr:MAG: glycosyltransferase family 1 protein [Deltaproteobacteria bacterium]